MIPVFGQVARHTVITVKKGCLLRTNTLLTGLIILLSLPALSSFRSDTLMSGEVEARALWTTHTSLQAQIKVRSLLRAIATVLRALQHKWCLQGAGRDIMSCHVGEQLDSKLHLSEVAVDPVVTFDVGDVLVLHSVGQFVVLHCLLSCAI